MTSPDERRDRAQRLAAAGPEPTILFPAPDAPNPLHTPMLPPSLMPAPILQPTPSPGMGPQFPTPSPSVLGSGVGFGLGSGFHPYQFPPGTPMPPPLPPPPPPPAPMQYPPTPSLPPLTPPPPHSPTPPTPPHLPTPPAPIPNPRLPRARQPNAEQTVLPHRLGAMDVECPDCHALHWMEEKTAKSSKANPKFGRCCRSGQVNLPFLTTPPDVLRDLLVGDGDYEKEFRENIRQYNNAFAFTSLGVTIDRSVQGGGPYCFKIQGELSHIQGTLLPSDDQAQFAQVYIYDVHEANQHRQSRNPTLQGSTLLSLEDMLRNCGNPFPHLYKHAYEQLRENPDGGANASLRLHLDTEKMDRRRYNLPTAEDEVAILIPDSNETAKEKRDIILRLRPPEGVQGLGLQRISEGQPAYAPLHYPMLFPRGELGWSWDIPLANSSSADQDAEDGNAAGAGDEEKSKTVTQLMYYAYRIHPRPICWEADTILRGGKLFQEFLCDAWAMTEQSRLNWLHHNQKTLRAEVYKGLADTVAADFVAGNGDMNNIGERFILPSSFTGGPRFMNQLFQDSMAINRYFSRPDAFLTMTTNPQWQEIQDALLPGQTASDRPDIVARVFHMKKEALLKELYSGKGIFGRTVAKVYTIEFQKRGLPHMHLLIFLSPEYKITQPAQVDSLISAELPDPVTEPRLFAIVTKCMLHGPCGPNHPSKKCMDKNICTKRYPRVFTEFTTLSDKSYPIYRRRNNGRTFTHKGFTYDNRWVVPYNPYLSLKYECHINVEICSSVKAIKYVYKYVYKGGDKATAQIVLDEIKHYLDSRYVSASEAAYHLHRFPMHKEDPNVQRLAIHLPDEHMVVFDPDQPADQITTRAQGKVTTLMGFFAANQEFPQLASQYTYQDFPAHFVWNISKKKWTIRKKGFAIGRMYFIQPLAGELYYLRMLLTIRKGVTSFDAVRTVQDTLQPTFKAACLALGLLEDDHEWDHALTEGATFRTGRALRELFATILIYGPPSTPETLWEKHRSQICDDLPRVLERSGHLSITDDVVYDYGLYLLNIILMQAAKDLKDFPPMPTPVGNWQALEENRLIFEERHYDAAAEKAQADERVALFNEEQLQAFTTITQAVLNGIPDVFFLHGPAGTGKTFVYNTICNRLRGENLIVLCVASSGIASLLLVGGRTAHSRFKIPLDIHETSMCKVKPNTLLGELLCKVSLIIWDEAPMQHKHCFEAVDRTLRDVRKNLPPVLRPNGQCSNPEDLPFGGCTTVVGGDFSQILPVVPRGTREQTVFACLRRSYLWDFITVLHLRRNMRLEQGADNVEYAEWLLNIGSGQNLPEDGLISLKPGMQCTGSINDLINNIYTGIEESQDDTYFLGRTILSTRNSSVDEINQKVLNLFPGVSQTYQSADSIIEDPNESAENQPARDVWPIEWLNSLNASGLPLSQLSLKTGCPVMLLRNLNASEGLCNGSRMVVTRMKPHIIETRLIGGSRNGQVALIPRITLNPSDDDLPVRLSRHQFPLRLAFSMSINKSQGQSVQLVGVDLRDQVFTHGQLYVAFSRTTSASRIKVLLPTDSSKAQNVVYPEVLLH